MLIIKITRISN